MPSATLRVYQGGVQRTRLNVKPGERHQPSGWRGLMREVLVRDVALIILFELNL